jgi:hypothetical protein
MYRPLFAALPKDRNDRWELVRSFVGNWHAPLLETDGVTEDDIAVAERGLGVQLPTALREWYLLAGRKTAIWSRQDSLAQLGGIQLSSPDKALLFRWENQGCERWGICREDLRFDDPPVCSFEERSRLSCWKPCG